MIKNILFTVQLTAITLVSFAQKNNPVLMTVNGKEVRQSEFINIYTKNNPDPQYDKASLDEYMELFIKYKLKVTEAETLKMDTITKFKNELNGYKEQLARPYLTDNEMNDELVKQAYYRKSHEVKASHILIQDVNAKEAIRSGAVFGEAELKRITEIKAEIESGKITFEEAAKKYSQDPSAKQNNGLLGYFSAFQMVYPFEEAAFTTPVGKISDPVKTTFGYHIVKVLDKRKARGRIKVAHIYTKAPETGTAEQKSKAKKKINEIYELLESGKNFEKLAEEYSEDKTSAKKGGELDWFTTGRMLPKFEETSYNLAKKGDYSKPIKTSYGYHIIKKIDYEPIASFEKMENELKARISKDVRSSKSKRSFIDKLKKEYHFKDYSKKWMNAYQLAYNLSDNEEALRNFKNKKAFRYSLKKGWFSKKNKVYVGTFTNYLNQTTAKGKVIDVNKKYDAFVDQAMMDFERSRLEYKYPEYKALMQEYKDGILLFELTDQKVWKKASRDTTGLEAFYEKNKTNYMWDKRADVEIYTAVKKENIDKTYALLKDSGFNANTVVKTVNKSSQLNVSVDAGKYEIDKRDELKGIRLTEGISTPFIMDGKFIIVKTYKLIPPSIKKLDETKGIVISDYQNQLEKDWIEELRKKYPITINKDVLYSLGK